MTPRELTERIARLTEEAIRHQPEHWMWMYKRWKYIAPGADRARYPFYSRTLSAEEQSIHASR